LESIPSGQSTAAGAATSPVTSTILVGRTRKHLSLPVEFGFGQGEISESEKRSLTTMARNISKALSNQGAANAKNAARQKPDRQGGCAKNTQARRPRRESQHLFPLRKITFARANVQLRLCRRTYIDSPKACAGRLIIRIILKQVL